MRSAILLFVSSRPSTPLARSISVARDSGFSPRASITTPPTARAPRRAFQQISDRDPRADTNAPRNAPFPDATTIRVYGRDKHAPARRAATTRRRSTDTPVVRNVMPVKYLRFRLDYTTTTDGFGGR